MKSPSLSKSAFFEYMACPEAFWLKRHRPDAYPKSAPSAADRFAMAQGYEFEEIAKQALIAYFGDALDFQRTINSPDGLLARADAVLDHETGLVDLFEIKSGMKADAYFNDAAFQKIVAERAGLIVGEVYIIHANKNYRLEGELDPSALVTIAKVTDTAARDARELELHVDAALHLLSQSSIDEDGCSCRYKTRSHRCAAFAYFNPGIRTPSVYDLPGVRYSALQPLLKAGKVQFEDLDQVDLDKPAYNKMRASYAAQEPVVDREGLKAWISDLSYPLSFFDYETFKAPVPLFHGTSPHTQVPVQYSLHVLHENGALEHFEYLAETADLPEQLARQLKQDLPARGHILSWNMGFENGRNVQMAEWFPEYAAFFEDMIQRTRDLMLVFDGGKPFPEGAYVDWRFNGSTSIKNVLPVVVPELSYEGMNVANGGEAMAAWKKLLEVPQGARKDGHRQDMLAYCELDTFAMVKIFKRLQDLVN